MGGRKHVSCSVFRISISIRIHYSLNLNSNSKKNILKNEEKKNGRHFCVCYLKHKTENFPSFVPSQLLFPNDFAESS